MTLLNFSNDVLFRLVGRQELLAAGGGVCVGVASRRKIRTRRGRFQPQDQVQVLVERRQARRGPGPRGFRRSEPVKLVLDEARRLQGVVDVVRDAVVGVIGAAGVVDRAEVRAGGREHLNVSAGVAANVFDRALTLVLGRSRQRRRRRMHRPQRDVPLEGEKRRLRQEKSELVQVARRTPANNWTGPEVVAQVRMSVEEVVADVANDEDDQLVLVGLVAEQDSGEGAFDERPLGAQVGLGEDHEDPLAGIGRHGDSVEDRSAGGKISALETESVVCSGAVLESRCERVVNKVSLHVGVSHVDVEELVPDAAGVDTAVAAATAAVRLDAAS